MAAVIVWHWWGLIVVAVVAAAGVLLVRAIQLGEGRSETEAVIAPVGQRLAPAPRLSPVPDLGPVSDPDGGAGVPGDAPEGEGA